MKAYIYILTNQTNSTLYVGVTNNLVRRVYEHQNGFVDSFTKKYNLKKLVYFEQFDAIDQAIAREKQLKNWKREWKDALVVQENPHWEDLYGDIVENGYGE